MKAVVRNLTISVLSIAVIGTIADITFGTRPFFCGLYSIDTYLGASINRESYLEKLNSGKIAWALVYKDLGWARLAEQDGYRLELATTVDESFLNNLKAKVAFDVKFDEPLGIDAWCPPP